MNVVPSAGELLRAKLGFLGEAENQSGHVLLRVRGREDLCPIEESAGGSGRGDREVGLSHSEKKSDQRQFRKVPIELPHACELDHARVQGRKVEIFLLHRH